ncbi:hypothetical protein L1987_20312 [Smallanthus sonchifolius]|uniref:Uncharacterized protein n=1 Tax=Smallanthus sonchifolius TaxID=185202 RepID=A0ACB9IRP1_9ASTR|nr:hypothetical protein L1987_20312 [Smallanthus sonchifolius]
MAASSNTIEPWMFRSTVTDSWYPDAFARETESALTKALQQSFFSNPQQSEINHPISSSFLVCSTTPSAFTGSGSEPDTPGSKRNLGVSLGKPAKRKSRASKRSMTTFIQADPANFRQMVQQVTGVKLKGSGQLPVVKPEPMRQPCINKLQGLLPTLDTSAYLLHRQRQREDNNNNTSQLPEGGVDFYSFSGFPTLESSF